MKNKYTFEDYLQDVCPPERHTNNDPAGFDSWLEDQDVGEIMEYAENYGEIQFTKGEKSGLETALKMADEVFSK